MSTSTPGSGQVSVWRRSLDALVLWYALWQAFHLLFNLYGAFTGFATARQLLAPGLGDQPFRSMLASGWLDLFFVSPSGILFGSGWFSDRSWAPPLGLVSLSGAVVSAWVVYWLQYVWLGRVVLDDATARLTLLSFLPCVLLLPCLGLHVASPGSPGGGGST